MSKDRAIVLIEAVDWANYGGDTFLLPDDFKPMDGRVVGFLLDKNDDYISVAFEDFSDWEHDRVRIVQSIPLVCVKSIKYLEEKDV
jgi:hypothetical protein